MIRIACNNESYKALGNAPNAKEKLSNNSDSYRRCWVVFYKHYICWTVPHPWATEYQLHAKHCAGDTSERQGQKALPSQSLHAQKLRRRLNLSSQAAECGDHTFYSAYHFNKTTTCTGPALSCPPENKRLTTYISVYNARWQSLLWYNPGLKKKDVII